jgi:CRP/FNR family transcriptional regulator
MGIQETGINESSATVKNILSEPPVKDSPLCEIIGESADRKVFIYKKNNFLFHEGDIAGGIYFVLSGRVKIIKKEKQQVPVILYLVKPGGVLGIHAVVNEHSHTNSAVAMLNTEVCFIPAKEFRQIINKDNQHKICVMQLLCSNIDLLESKISSHSDRTASQRLAELLLLLADTYGTTEKQTLKIELSPEDLANLAGVSKIYFGRIIGDFCQKDWITVKGKTIRILDRENLAKEAKI